MSGGESLARTGSIPRMFFSRVEQSGDRPALFHKRAGRYLPIGYRDLGLAVRQVAAGLIDLGVKPGDRVAIMSYNRPEWAVADLAILSAGAVTVPIYQTSTREQADRILRQSGSRVAFVSRSEKAQMLLSCDSALETMVALDPAEDGGPGPCAVAYDALRKRGRDVMGGEAGVELERRIETGRPGDCATIVFTSGTTGEPKGVMLSHGNLLSNAAAGLAAQPVGDGDLSLSFLPLSHLFERTIGYYLMLLAGVPIAYAGSVRTVAADARLVRPTVMLVVPRFLEKFREKVAEKVKAAPVWRRLLFWLALIAGRRLRRGGDGAAVPGRLSVLLLRGADRLVLGKLREGLGGRLRFIVCGGAPLGVGVLEFFQSIGLEVLEGYGLSEASPVISVNRLGRVRPGTVGIPFDNLEVRTAADGEILVRGPSVMMGYLQDTAATDEVLRDGWLSTGDIGVIEDGYLRITDRKKDIIVTSGGKNISPRRVESLLEEDDCIRQVVVYGDRRKYLTALVVPDYDSLRETMDRPELESLGDEALAGHREVNAFLMERIGRRSAGLAGFERVKKIAVLAEPLTEAEGDVTPTMKVRRGRVTRKFRDRLDALYTKADLEL